MKLSRFRWFYTRFLAIGFTLTFVAWGFSQDDYVQSTGEVCGMEGNASRESDRELNRLKNRYHAPSTGEIDSRITLAALLAPGDDIDRFDVAKAARIAGYVVAVKVGGVETCNCKATSPIDRDTHIELALHQNAPENQRFIVEVSPRFRAQVASHGIDWTTTGLKSSSTGIRGKWVEIEGWLFFDYHHVDEAENTGSGDRNIWRATAWELHPISKIEVSNEPPIDSAFASNVLTQMQRTVRNELLTDADALTSRRARNAQILAQFEAEEMDGPPEVDSDGLSDDFARRFDEGITGGTWLGSARESASHPTELPTQISCSNEFGTDLTWCGQRVWRQGECRGVFRGRVLRNLGANCGCRR